MTHDIDNLLGPQLDKQYIRINHLGQSVFQRLRLITRRRPIHHRGIDVRVVVHLPGVGLASLGTAIAVAPDTKVEYQCIIFTGGVGIL